MQAPWHTCGAHRTACRDQFSPSTALGSLYQVSYLAGPSSFFFFFKSLISKKKKLNFTNIKDAWLVVVVDGEYFKDRKTRLCLGL